IRSGLTAVTPFLLVPTSRSNGPLYARSRRQRNPVRRDPAGHIQHAVIHVDDAPVELGRHADARGSDGRVLPAVGLHLYVADVDAVCERAREVGLSATPPTEMPYGDRENMMIDRFGITWCIATNLR